MKLILDCMGGDRGPAACLAGVAEAKATFGGEYILVGNRVILETEAQKQQISLQHYEIVDTTEVISMEDDPMAVVRAKSESSMSVALRMLAEGKGHAVVSCGNTGALFLGASLIVRRVRGVHRAAIATVLPFTPPVLLLDAGANVTVQPEYLTQFASMGTAYMKHLFGLEHPRVGLLNNGTETSKGTPLQIEAHRLLSQCADINFVGNVESSMLPFDACDIVVTDGFTGNVILKAFEGMGKLVMGRMKDIFYATPTTKLAALAVKGQLTQFKHDFDATEYGGSPILGLNRPVIKAHGSSDAKAIKNAIGQAIRYAETGAVGSISQVFVSPVQDT